MAEKMGNTGMVETNNQMGLSILTDFLCIILTMLKIMICLIS